MFVLENAVGESSGDEMVEGLLHFVVPVVLQLRNQRESFAESGESNKLEMFQHTLNLDAIQKQCFSR